MLLGADNPKTALFPVKVPLVLEKVIFPEINSILKCVPADNPYTVHVIVDFPEMLTVKIFPSSAFVGDQFALFASNTAEDSLGKRVV